MWVISSQPRWLEYHVINVGNRVISSSQIEPLRFQDVRSRLHYAVPGTKKVVLTADSMHGRWIRKSALNPRQAQLWLRSVPHTVHIKCWLLQRSTCRLGLPCGRNERAASCSWKLKDICPYSVFLYDWTQTMFLWNIGADFRKVLLTH